MIVDEKRTPLNLTDLAKCLNVSRRTVYNYVKLGYSPEFGNRTTVAHAKKWLREVYAPQVLKAKRERKLAQELVLDRLR